MFSRVVLPVELLSWGLLTASEEEKRSVLQRHPRIDLCQAAAEGGDLPLDLHFRLIK